jgi:UPF0755 protein
MDYTCQKSFYYVVIIFLVVVLGYALFFTAPDNFPKGIIINVSEGENLRNLSFDLKEKNLIRSRVAFEAFVILYGNDKHLSIGDYLFESKIPVFEVARRIIMRDRHLAPIRVTIPEGYDLSQITETFALKLKNFNQARFLSEASGSEGYLFPDTYFFPTTASERDVFSYLSQNFKKKIAPLLPEIASSGKTEKEIITMASIIEWEASGSGDRNIISGILWNRIKKGMPLQVDAVPETYQKRGLPENPICNPGTDAIEAALYPTLSPYLYYLHDKAGVIHYARTFEEHKQNKLKYL